MENVPQQRKTDYPATQSELAISAEEAIIKLYEHNYAVYRAAAERFVTETQAVENEQLFHYMAGYTDDLLLDLGKELKSLRNQGAAAIRSIALGWQHRIR